jgi:hypothetical protein
LSFDLGPAYRDYLLWLCQSSLQLSLKPKAELPFDSAMRRSLRFNVLDEALARRRIFPLSLSSEQTEQERTFVRYLCVRERTNRTEHDVEFAWRYGLTKTLEVNSRLRTTR